MHHLCLLRSMMREVMSEFSMTFKGVLPLVLGEGYAQLMQPQWLQPIPSHE
jgi:hypothetical protein